MSRSADLQPTSRLGRPGSGQGSGLEPVARVISGTPLPAKPGGFLTSLLQTPSRTIIPPLSVLGLWQLGSAAGIVDGVFFPAPSRIATALIALARSGTILHALLLTLERVGAGFVLGTIPAVALGVVMARVPRVRAVIDPIIATTYPIPSVALLPVLFVLLGLGSRPIIGLAAIICFYPSVINTMAGVNEVDERLVRMARNLGASRLQILTKISLPGALPSIFAGIRLGLGLALLGAVAGEFIGSPDGIGALMWSYWQTYEITNMYAALAVIVATGFTLTYTTMYVRDRFFGWASAALRERR